MHEEIPRKPLLLVLAIMAVTGLYLIFVGGILLAFSA